MFVNRAGCLNVLLNCVPRCLGKLALVKDVKQLFTLSGIYIQPVTTNKLQRVPLPGIMTGGDRDAAVSLQPLNCQLHARCGADAEIHYLTTCRQQARQNSRPYHRTRRSRVAADKDSPPVEVRSIGFGKLD